ncbi:MAG: aspartate-semialdehyde dehydrogenase [Vampirovibrionales bacterium]|nr:aspartate-semialdehyde dehydrogenase [Vampirovibrionales bacterium]
MSSQREYTVAVLGATGLVGAHLIEILAERKFPVKMLKPLASQRSLGSTILFNGQEIPVEEATPEAFEGVDIVLASAGGAISKALVPEAVKRGALVIDNTSEFRLKPDVPLVVAGVNDADIESHNGIIANPNCSTAQLMPVFKALHEAAGLKRAIISTYQSVSGAGKDGMEELFQTTCDFVKKTADGSANERLSAPMSGNKVFSRPLAFNLIPHIDVFMDEGDEAGYTKEETKLIHETKKILHLPDLKLTATAVRVPVMVGHSEAVTLEFEKPITPEEATRILRETPDVVVAETREDYPTPLEVTGKDPVYVGRIRKDTSNPETGLCLWVVADNLRIGAALNAVRIAEAVARNNWLKPKQAV